MSMMMVVVQDRYGASHRREEGGLGVSSREGHGGVTGAVGRVGGEGDPTRRGGERTSWCGPRGDVGKEPDGNPGS